jgi:hypothetical protein
MVPCFVNDCERVSKRIVGNVRYCTMHYNRYARNGHTGLVQHRLSYTPEYQALHNIKDRCYNPKNKRYKHYGGRGIKVCKRWLGKDGYVNFVKDLGKRPSAKHSIDRINNDGNYTPANCRWSNIFQQNANRSICVDYPGVNKNGNCWVASITINQKRISRKTFKNYEDAVTARKNLEMLYLPRN